MEKMTVRDLQCKLYVETLREEYKNRDFMFTTIGENDMSHIMRWIEIKVKEIEERENLSDEDLKYSCDHTPETVDDIRERLNRTKKYLIDKIQSSRIQDCKDRDFALALLFACWKKKFASVNSSDATIIDSYIQHELVIDADKVCKNVLAENYSEYVSLHTKKHIRPTYEDEVFNIISEYDGWDGKHTLEIDTDFFGKSTKIMSNKTDYVVSKVLRDLIVVESEVYCCEDMVQMPHEKSFGTIVAKLSSCKNQSLDGIMEFFNDLVAHAETEGRIILIDTERFLVSDEMYEFRKKMIEESLLEIFVGGRFGFTDVYILHAHGASENVSFNFVCDHQHYYSVSDNILTLHNKLSKSDVASIDYNFYATSDLVVGHQGRAYSFCDLFSVPKTGVEEKKLSGVYHVFQMKDMPHDFDGIVKNNAALDECEIAGSFNVITENKLIFFIGDDKIQCCYIEASEENPVIVGHQFVVLDLNTEVLTPEYMQILCAKGFLDKVFDMGNWDRPFFRCIDCFDDYNGKECLVTPEDKIVNIISTMIQIPSLEQQRKEFDDVKFVNASSVEREKALEMLLKDKTWLNEEHIRNIKHRIGNELLPIKNDIDAMTKLMERHPEGITLDTIRGKDERVSEMLVRLTRCISRVNESLQDLTRIVDKGNLKPVDIVATVRDFVKDAIINKAFKINMALPEERIYVNGSISMINSILRNIVDNAVRHGFVDKYRQDYAIEIAIDKDGNGNCVLDVKNNGAPMNELARDSYFKRGSIAGLTGHSGIGGADIKDTANAMGGEVTLPICENGWSVCVRISFPIFNSEKL